MMIKTIIKFGIPVIAAILYSLSIIYVNKASDSLGSAGRIFDLIIIWIPILIIFLIIGFIVRYKTGNSFVLHSFILSLTTMMLVFIIFFIISEIKYKKEEINNSPEQLELRLQNDLKRVEEITLQINQNANNYKLLSERGILYYNTNQYEKAIPDLIIAIENEQADAEVYDILIWLYSRDQEYEKAIEYCNLVLNKDEEGKIKLTDEQRSNFIYIRYSAETDLEEKLKENSK